MKSSSWTGSGGIAQIGLAYARDPYDQRRYAELIRLAAEGYERFTGVPAGEIADRFRADTGYVTAKVGVDGAVFDDSGERLLLIRRADSGSWALRWLGRFRRDSRGRRHP